MVRTNWHRMSKGVKLPSMKVTYADGTYEDIPSCYQHEYELRSEASAARPVDVVITEEVSEEAYMYILTSMHPRYANKLRIEIVDTEVVQLSRCGLKGVPCE